MRGTFSPQHLCSGNWGLERGMTQHLTREWGHSVLSQPTRAIRHPSAVTMTSIYQALSAACSRPVGRYYYCRLKSFVSIPQKLILGSHALDIAVYIWGFWCWISTTWSRSGLSILKMGANVSSGVPRTLTQCCAGWDFTTCPLGQGHGLVAFAGLCNRDLLTEWEELNHRLSLECCSSPSGGCETEETG